MDIAYTVALLDRYGRVVATSSDLAAVRLAASMIARRPDRESDDPVFQPIAAGRSVACRAVALGAV